MKGTFALLKHLAVEVLQSVFVKYNPLSRENTLKHNLSQNSVNVVKILLSCSQEKICSLMFYYFEYALECAA